MRRCYPTISLIQQEKNVGFAEGNNIGIRRALELGADYVFLLNNDTTIAVDAIARCIEVAQLRPDTGAVCPLIYFAEPPNSIWYAGATFDSCTVPTAGGCLATAKSTAASSSLSARRLGLLAQPF